MITYYKDFVFYIIERMWCMLFHKHLWEENGGDYKCTKCGQDFDGADCNLP